MTKSEMTIGRFALQTGLSQRALRLYAERGILIPAQTDPVTGYRHYGPGQVRTGMLIKELRGAGVPMSELADLDDFSIDEYAERLRTRREAEDSALELARAIDTFDAGRWPVRVCPAAAQPWVGLQVAAPIVDDGTADQALADLDDPEIANACFAALYTESKARGNPPTDVWWTTMSVCERDNSVQLALCWPLATDPRQADWAEFCAAVIAALPSQLVERLIVIAGVLPERHEVSAVSSTLDDDASTAEVIMSGTGPCLAVLEHCLEQGLEQLGNDLRARGVLDQQGMTVGQEYVLDIRASKPR